MSVHTIYGGPNAGKTVSTHVSVHTIYDGPNKGDTVYEEKREDGTVISRYTRDSATGEVVSEENNMGQSNSYQSSGVMSGGAASSPEYVDNRTWQEQMMDEAQDIAFMAVGTVAEGVRAGVKAANSAVEAARKEAQEERTATILAERGKARQQESAELVAMCEAQAYTTVGAKKNNNYKLVEGEHTVDLTGLQDREQPTLLEKIRNKQYDESYFEAEARTEEERKRQSEKREQEYKYQLADSCDPKNPTTYGTRYQVHPVTMDVFDLMQERPEDFEEVAVVENSHADYKEDDSHVYYTIGAQKLKDSHEDYVLRDRQTGKLYQYRREEADLERYKTEEANVSTAQERATVNYESTYTAEYKKAGIDMYDKHIKQLTDEINSMFISQQVHDGEDKGTVRSRLKDLSPEEYQTLVNKCNKLEEVQEARKEKLKSLDYITDDYTNTIKTLNGIEGRLQDSEFYHQFTVSDYATYHEAKTLYEDMARVEAGKMTVKELADRHDGYEYKKGDRETQNWARENYFNLRDRYQASDGVLYVDKNSGLLASIQEQTAKRKKAHDEFILGFAAAENEVVPDTHIYWMESSQVNSFVDIIRREIARNKYGAYNTTSWDEDVKALEHVGVLSQLKAYSRGEQSFGEAVLNVGRRALAEMNDFDDFKSVWLKGLWQSNALFDYHNVYGEIGENDVIPAEARQHTLPDGKRVVRYDGLDSTVQKKWADRVDMNAYQKYLAAYMVGDLAMLPTQNEIRTYYETKDEHDNGSKFYTNYEMYDKVLKENMYTHGENMLEDIIDIPLTLFTEMVSDPETYLTMGKNLGTELMTEEVKKGAKSVITDVISDAAARQGYLLDEYLSAAIDSKAESILAGYVKDRGIKSFDDLNALITDACNSVTDFAVKNMDDVEKAAKTRMYKTIVANANEYLDSTLGSQELKMLWTTMAPTVYATNGLKALETMANGLMGSVISEVFHGIKYVAQDTKHVATKAADGIIGKLNEYPAFRRVSYEVRNTFSTIYTHTIVGIGTVLEKLVGNPDSMNIEAAAKLMRKFESASALSILRTANKADIDPTDILIHHNSFSNRMINKIFGDSARADLSVYVRNAEAVINMRKYADPTEFYDELAQALGYENFAAHRTKLLENAIKLEEYDIKSYGTNVRRVLDIIDNNIVHTRLDNNLNQLARTEKTFKQLKNLIWHPDDYAQRIGKSVTAKLSGQEEAMSELIASYKPLCPGLQNAQLMHMAENELFDIDARVGFFEAVLENDRDYVYRDAYGIFGTTPTSVDDLNNVTPNGKVQHNIWDALEQYMKDRDVPNITPVHVQEILRNNLKDLSVKDVGKVYSIMLSKGNNMKALCTPEVVECAEKLIDTKSVEGRFLQYYRDVCTAKEQPYLDKLYKDCEAIVATSRVMNAIELSGMSPTSKMLVTDAYAGRPEDMNKLYSKYKYKSPTAIDDAVNSIIEASTVHGNAMNNKVPNVRKYGFNTVSLKSNVSKMLESGFLPEDDEHIDIFVSMHKMSKSDPFAISMVTRDGNAIDMYNLDSYVKEFNPRAIEHNTGFSYEQLRKNCEKEMKGLHNREFYQGIQDYLNDINEQAKGLGKQIRFVTCDPDVAATGTHKFLSNMSYNNHMFLHSKDYVELCSNDVRLAKHMDGVDDLYRFSEQDKAILRATLKREWEYAALYDNNTVCADLATNTFCNNTSFQHITDMFEDTELYEYLNNMSKNVGVAARNMSGIVPEGYDPIMNLYIDSDAFKALLDTNLREGNAANIQQFLEDYTEEGLYNLKLRYDADVVRNWFPDDSIPLQQAIQSDLYDLSKKLDAAYDAIKGWDRFTERGVNEELANNIQRAAGHILAENASNVANPLRDVLTRCVVTNTKGKLSVPHPRRALAAIYVASQEIPELSSAHIYSWLDTRTQLYKCMFTEQGRRLRLFQDVTNVRYSSTASDLLTLNKSGHMETVEELGDALTQLKEQRMRLEDVNSIRSSLLAEKQLLDVSGADNAASRAQLLSEIEFVDRYNDYLTLINQDLEYVSDLAHIDTTMYNAAEQKITDVKYISGPVAADVIMNDKNGAIHRYYDHEAHMLGEQLVKADTLTFNSLILQQRNALVIEPDSYIFKGVDTIAGVTDDVSSKILDRIISLDDRYVVRQIEQDGHELYVVSLKLDKFKSEEIDAMLKFKVEFSPSGNIIVNNAIQAPDKIDKEISAVQMIANWTKKFKGEDGKVTEVNVFDNTRDKLDKSMRFEMFAFAEAEKTKVDRAKKLIPVYKHVNDYNSHLNTKIDGYTNSTRKMVADDDWRTWIDELVGENTVRGTILDNSNELFICNMFCDDAVYKAFTNRPAYNVLANAHNSFQFHSARMAAANDLLGYISSAKSYDDIAALPKVERMKLIKDRGLCAIRVTNDTEVETIDTAQLLKHVHNDDPRVHSNITLVNYDDYCYIRNRAKMNAIDAAATRTPYAIQYAKKVANRIRSAYIMGSLYLGNLLGTGLRNVYDSSIKAVDDVNIIGADSTVRLAKHWAEAPKTWDIYNTTLADVYARTGNVGRENIEQYYAELAATGETALADRDWMLEWFGVAHNAGLDGFTDDLTRKMHDIDVDNIKTALRDSGVHLTDDEWDGVNAAFQYVADAQTRKGVRGFEDGLMQTRDKVAARLRETCIDDPEKATTIADYFQKWRIHARAHNGVVDAMFDGDNGVSRTLRAINANAFDNAEMRVRTAMIQSWMDAGLSAEDANLHVVKTQFNYGERPEWLEKFEWFVPFSTYQYYNAKYWIDPSNYNGLMPKFQKMYWKATDDDGSATYEGAKNQILYAYLRNQAMKQNDNGYDTSYEESENPYLDVMFSALADDVSNYKGVREGSGYINGIKFSDTHYLKTGNGMRDTLEELTKLAMVPAMIKNGELPEVLRDKVIPPFKPVLDLLSKDWRANLKENKSWLDNLKKWSVENRSDALNLVPVVGNLVNIAIQGMKAGKANTSTMLAASTIGGTIFGSAVIDNVMSTITQFGYAALSGAVGTYYEKSNYYDREVFKQYRDEETGKVVTWYDLTPEEKKKYRYMMGVSYVPSSIISPKDHNNMYWKLRDLGMEHNEVTKVLNACYNSGAWVRNSAYWYRGSDGKNYVRSDMIDKIVLEMLGEGYQWDEVQEMLRKNHKWWNLKTGTIMEGTDYVNAALSSFTYALYKNIPDYIKYSDQYQKQMEYYKHLGFDTAEAMALMANSTMFIDLQGDIHTMSADGIRQLEAALSANPHWDKDDSFWAWFQELPDAIKYEKGAYGRTKHILNDLFDEKTSMQLMAKGFYADPTGKLYYKPDKSNPIKHAKSAFQDEHGYWHRAGDYQVNGYWFHKGDVPYAGYKDFNEFYNHLPNYMRFTKGAYSTTNRVLKNAGYDYNTRTQMMLQGTIATYLTPEMANMYLNTEEGRRLMKEKGFKIVQSENSLYLLQDCSTWETKKYNKYGGRKGYSKYYTKEYTKYYKKTGYSGRYYRNFKKWYSRHYTYKQRGEYIRNVALQMKYVKAPKPMHIKYSNVRTFSKVHYVQQTGSGWRYWYKWGDAKGRNNKRMPSSYRNPLARSRNMYKDLYTSKGMSRMVLRQNNRGYSNASITRYHRNEINNRLAQNSVRIGRTSGTARYNRNR